MSSSSRSYRRRFARYCPPRCQLSDRDLVGLTEELAGGVRAVTLDVPDVAEGLEQVRRGGRLAQVQPANHPWRKFFSRG